MLLLIQNHDGCAPTQPIVIEDSDRESNAGSSAPPRHLFQARKHVLLPGEDHKDATPRRNRRRSRSKPPDSPDVFYPDLSARIPRAGSKLPSCSSGALSQDQPNRPIAQRQNGKEGTYKRSLVRDTTTQEGTQERPIDLISVSDKPVIFVDPSIEGKALAATRKCLVCGEDSLTAELPSLAGCKHIPQTCAMCYAGWIGAQLQGSSWREARCAESRCDVTLTYDEIRRYASRETFENYDTYIARAALNEDPNFRWCRQCKSGQIHHDGNIFTCASCDYKMCTIHEDSWHEGETCEEYDYRSLGCKAQDRRAQEEASLAEVHRLSKKCPGRNCVYNIEKNDGCDHMTCLRCRHEFCWVCLCDYSEVIQLGNSAHAEDCKYHTSRLI